jgi:hypothetical protein
MSADVPGSGSWPATGRRSCSGIRGFGAVLASITHWNPTGCASAMLEPMMTMQSECRGPAGSPSPRRDPGRCAKSYAQFRDGVRGVGGVGWCWGWMLWGWGEGVSNRLRFGDVR